MLCFRVVWYIYTDVSEQVPASIAGGNKFGGTVDRHLHYTVKLSGNGKALPLQAIGGPEGSRKLSLLDFLTTAQYGSRLSAFTPRDIPGTHFH